MGVAGIIAPIFAVIALGAAAVKWRAVDAHGLRGITDFTFYLGMPALLFTSVVEADTFSLVDVALLYFLGCLVIFTAGVVLAMRLFGASLASAAMTGLNACFGNTGMLVLPLIAAAFGADGVGVLIPIIAVHSLVLLPVATMLIEADGRRATNPLRVLAASVPSLLRNPIIVALVVSGLWKALGVPVPVPLHRLLTMLAASAPPMALFVLGGSMPGMMSEIRPRETALPVVLKLIVQPALIWFLAHQAGLSPLQTSVAVITAGAPTGANAFFLARRLSVSMAASAGVVVVGTACSLVTLTVLLAVLPR